MLQSAVDYTAPDIIIGSESKLDATILSSEVFPTGYDIYRKDRDKFGGGVFIAV